MSTNIQFLDFEGLRGEFEKLATDSLLFVLDGNMWGHYKQELNVEKEFAGKKVHIWKSPGGEKTKDFAEFKSGVEFFLSRGIHRNSHLIAIGGGATTDFGGFVAACLLRGVSWSSVPTTLLGMVDASIGGKVGMNSAHGKNLVGAFHMPQNVWINPAFLTSLDEGEELSGRGEILKYAFLSKVVYDKVKDPGHSLEEVIHACAAYKEDIVNLDFKESGKRKFLNLGHTLGHAIEYHYRLSHGEAVLWGMALIFLLFQEGKLIKELRELASILDMPKDPPWLNKSFPLDEIISLVLKDKKMVTNDEVDLVIVEEIGRPGTQKTTVDAIADKIRELENDVRTFRL